MPAKIDFYYHRKSCETCAKSLVFIGTHKLAVKEQVDARKTRYSPEEALAMTEQVSTLIASRGKSVVRFDLKKNPPDRETLLKHLVGPHGTMRAPVLRKGKTLLVGFNNEAYAEALT